MSFTRVLNDFLCEETKEDNVFLHFNELLRGEYYYSLDFILCKEEYSKLQSLFNNENFDKEIIELFMSEPFGRRFRGFLEQNRIDFSVKESLN